MPEVHRSEIPFDVLPCGYLFGQDDSGKLHFQSTPKSTALETQFIEVEEKLARQVHLDPKVQIAFSLVINDVCISRKSHRAALDAIGSAYKRGKSIFIDMPYTHGWRDRRRLSEQTIALLQQQNAPFSLSAYDMRVANATLCNALELKDSNTAWDMFYTMAAAYWGSSMPKLLWSHCLHLSPMQPLSRATHVRMQTGLPLRHACSVDEMKVPIEKSAYFSAQIQTHSMATILDAIQLIVDEASENHSRQSFVKNVTKGLRGLIPNALLEGRHQVLMILFGIDLVTNGGVNGELAIGSMVDYIQSTFPKLLTALLDKSIDALSGDDWLRLYQSILKQSSGNDAQVRATLSAFHDFLQWLDVPPLPRSIGELKDQRPPRAEVVWDPECRRAIEWITFHADPADRVAQQAVMTILILNELLIRVEEVLNLRLCDVHFHSGICTIFVYPRISDGSMKSSGVRHPREVTDEMTLRYLRRWCAQRTLEVGTDPNAYLFGHRRDPKRRYEPGLVYQLIVLSLKVATGDPSASTHCPRHRNASLAVTELSMPDSPIVEYGAIDQVSCDAGQNVTASLRETYVNIFETPLYAHAQKRRPYLGNEIDWEALSWIPEEADGVELDTIDAWKATPFPSHIESNNLGTVIDCLIDLGNDSLSDHSIAFRNNMSVKQVHFVAKVACERLDLFTSPGNMHPDPSMDFHSRRLKLKNHKPMLLASLQDKYFELRNWIDFNSDDIGTRNLVECCLSDCKSTVKHWHLSCDDQRDCFNVIDLIQKAKIPPSRLLITHCLAEENLPIHVRRLRWTIDKPRRHRRGEPRIRLHICSVDAESPGAIDAARSVKGLFGLLCAASAFFNMKSPKE